MNVLRRRTLVLNVVLGVALLLVLGAGFAALAGGGPPEPEPTTATVHRGTVIGAVAASGEVVSPGDVGVDFQSGGEVVEVFVDVGSRVTAGDVLARVDDTRYAEQLTVAEAHFDAATAARSELSRGRTAAQQRATSAERALANLRVEQAEAALELAGELNEDNVEGLDAQLEAARDQRDRMEDVRDRARDARRATCDDSGEDSAPCFQARQTEAQAQAQRDQARAAADEAERIRRQGRLNEQHAMQEARRQIQEARLNRDAVIARDDATVEVTAAQRARADAELAQARQQLSQAERDLDRTALRAPHTGVVAQRNVSVGDTVAGGGQPASAAGADGAFVLTEIGDREISALFSEADATRIEVGQPAVVTFDALPELSLNGQVRRIDVTPTVTGNLVRYGVRVTVDDLPGTVRTGQTATAEVITGQVDDALYVPTTAVSTVGTTTTVIVWDGETREERDVGIGIQGDQHTEILTGLDEGDEVVLPTTGTATMPDIMGPGGFQEPSTEPAGAGGD